MDSGESEVEGDDDGVEGGDGAGTSSGADLTEDNVYIPGQHPIDEGEELVHDSSAYHMYHAVCYRFKLPLNSSLTLFFASSLRHRLGLLV